MTPDLVHVAVIQTSLNHANAWRAAGTWQETVQISEAEENLARRELRRSLASLKSSEAKPDIILIPELSVPNGFAKQLEGIASALEAIVIAGMDYQIERTAGAPTVANRAVVIVPARIRGRRRSANPTTFSIGKTFPAPGEAKQLKKANVAFKGHPAVWLFDSDTLGRFGVAVCYDFLDLDRIAMYRGRISHLFVLAYNRDIASFDHVAEAVSRMAFCNVVICNCGHFGGSAAVSPFWAPYRRVIYRHSGMGLPNVQVVRLPLANLSKAQNKIATFIDGEQEFKSLPPGFRLNTALSLKGAKI